VVQVDSRTVSTSVCKVQILERGHWITPCSRISNILRE
jgi:hypothetical protein